MSDPGRESRCDGCAAAWEHRDEGGKWCSSCFVPRLEARLTEAHGGLLRALDYRAATPNGLAIRDEVRAALRRSGFSGELGEMSAPPRAGVSVRVSEVDPLRANNEGESR
jgi:hypothetical protein